MKRQPHSSLLSHPKEACPVQASRPFGPWLMLIFGEASPLPGKIVGRVGASKMASGKFPYLCLACSSWS